MQVYGSVRSSDFGSLRREVVDRLLRREAAVDHYPVDDVSISLFDDKHAENRIASPVDFAVELSALCFVSNRHCTGNGPFYYIARAD